MYGRLDARNYTLEDTALRRHSFVGDLANGKIGEDAAAYFSFLPFLKGAEEDSPEPEASSM